jgi:hypothetical protein
VGRSGVGGYLLDACGLKSVLDDIGEAAAFNILLVVYVSDEKNYTAKWPDLFQLSGFVALVVCDVDRVTRGW